MKVVHCIQALLLFVFTPAALAAQGGHPPEALVTIKAAPVAVTVGGPEADLPAYNSRAIQLAVDAVASRGGGTVRLGPGTFEMVGPVRLASNVTLEGSGSATILHKSDGARTHFVVDADYGMLKITVEDPSGFHVGTGLELFDDQNNSAWDVSTAVITAVDGRVLYLDSPTVRDYLAEKNGVVTNAFSLVEGVGVENVRIANLVIDGNGATNDYINGCRGGGVYLHKAKNCTVEGVHVKHFHGDSFSWQTTENITIRNCEASHGGGLGFHPGTGSDGTLMEDCVSHDNDEDGIFLCWRVQHGIFRRNKSYANKRFGISIGHQDTDNVFVDNEVYENGRHGVFFRNETEPNGGHRNTLRGNVIENNGTLGGPAYGVFIGGTTHDIRLEGNTIRSTGKGNQVGGVYIGAGAGQPGIKDNRISGHPEVVRQDAAASPTR